MSYSWLGHGMSLMRLRGISLGRGRLVLLRAAGTWLTKA
jgi:hypothetical protein